MLSGKAMHVALKMSCTQLYQQSSGSEVTITYLVTYVQAVTRQNKSRTIRKVPL